MSALKLKDEIKFGKYKGWKVEDIVYHQPGYIEWLAIERAKQGEEIFDKEVLEKLPGKERRAALLGIATAGKRVKNAGADKLRDTLQANAARLAEQAETTRETTARQEKTYADFGSW